MDGRGRWMDNVFIERLWRSVKHEGIYLKGYADGHEARGGIASWVSFYNLRHPDQAVGRQTPMAVWRMGVAGDLRNMAVDITLRLDNAGALPTCSQPPQQQAVQMDGVGKCCDDMAEESGGLHLPRAVAELDDGELRDAVNGQEHDELAFGRALP